MTSADLLSKAQRALNRDDLTTARHLFEQVPFVEHSPSMVRARQFLDGLEARAA